MRAVVYQGPSRVEDEMPDVHVDTRAVGWTTLLRAPCRLSGRTVDGSR